MFYPCKYLNNIKVLFIITPDNPFLDRLLLYCLFHEWQHIKRKPNWFIKLINIYLFTNQILWWFLYYYNVFLILHRSKASFISLINLIRNSKEIPRHVLQSWLLRYDVINYKMENHLSSNTTFYFLLTNMIS